MARYITQQTTASITGATTIGAPFQGGTLVTFTGSAPYTVVLPSPVLFPGISNQFYNNTGGVVTLSTPAGVFNGASMGGAGTHAIPNLGIVTIIPDGTNYIGWYDGNGPVAASTLSSTAATTLSPASANVVISPTGSGVVTINPATTGAMDNVAIGSTTASSVRATTLTATGTTTIQQMTEKLNPLTGASGTVAHDYTTGTVFYHTSIGANFTVNLTNTPTTAARSITITLLLIQGGTPFIPNGFQINGSGVTIQWPGGVTPSGRANKVDIATFILLNPSGSFTYVLGQYGSFG
jgi:hypothetical protein